MSSRARSDLPAVPETGTAPRVLVVEDDRDLAGMLAELLVLDGYEVDLAHDGHRGLHLLLGGTYAVVVLDRGLPAVEGLDLLARARARGVSTPVLVLSALGLARDRVEGLDAGAEDYLPKPFDADELLARLRALRRRHLDTSAVLPVPGGSLDTGSRTLALDDGRRVALSDREALLLAVLARRSHRVFTRAELVEAVFPDAEAAGVVDTYVHYLRRKGGEPLVRTVRGVGYQLGRR